ncbi:MAG: adenine phosphoribosyltransferase [Bacteroidetes bacterium]|nr:adenine phosphoribosyltransferase [Bacteroidota bacterium]MCH8523620.1 adenine phosphoribosyltransferase [Balneolales bacterium]
MSTIDKEILNFLEANIRTIPDFPKKGIQFKDITPLLGNPEAVYHTTRLLVKPFIQQSVDYVIGLESRGFLFGPRLAMDLHAGFIPVRKPNRLPYKTVRSEYELEYGTDAVEMHADAFKSGANVIIHDDLIATGGTAGAAADLVKQLGGNVIGFSFIIELCFLHGVEKLNNIAPSHSLIKI